MKTMLLDRGWQVCAEAVTTTGAQYCVDWKPSNGSIQFRRSAVLNHAAIDPDNDNTMLSVIPSTLYDSYAAGSILHPVIENAALDGFHPYDSYNEKLVPNAYAAQGINYHNWINFELDKFNINHFGVTERYANEWLQCSLIPVLKTHISQATLEQRPVENYFSGLGHVPIE